MFNVLWKALFPKYIGVSYHTVRYAFPLVIVTALFASLASVVSQDVSYITIRTSSEEVTRDQQFTIDVIATVNVPVNAVDLVISYPEELMDIETIDTGTSVITLWTEEPYAKDGAIYLRGGTFRKGFLGEHTIARIKAHATEAGNARIILKDSELVAGDGKGTNVPVTPSKEHNEVVVSVSGADGIITGEASITIVSDTDGDGDVDLRDISSFMAAWLTKGKLFDFNGDGKMSFVDFSIILSDSFRK